MIIHRIIYHPDSREGQQFYSQAWNKGPYKELYRRFRESESLVSKGSQPLPEDPFSNKCVDLAEAAVNKNLKIKDVCVKDVVLATDSIISSLISETMYKFQTKKKNMKHSEKISVLQMTELERKKSFQLRKVFKILDNPSLKTSFEMKTRKISTKPDIMIQFKEMIRDKVCLLCETDQKKRKIPHREFVDHLFGHFELGTHYCQRCDRTFRSASAMSHHITYMHELRLRQKAMTRAAGTPADNEIYQALMSRLKTKMISQSTTLTELRTAAAERASMKEKKIRIKNAHKKQCAKKQPVSSASTRPSGLEVGSNQNTRPLALEVGNYQNRTHTWFNLVQVIPVTCVPVIPVDPSYLHQSDLAENPGSFVNKPVQSDAAEQNSDDFTLSAEEQRYFHLYLRNQATSLPSLSANGDLNFSFEELRFIFLQRQKVLSTEQNTLQSSEIVRDTSPDSYLINRNVRMKGTSLIKKRKKTRSRKSNLSSSQISSAKNTPSKDSSNTEKMSLPSGRISKRKAVDRPTTDHTSASERMEILGLKKVVSTEERTHENSEIVRDKSPDLNLLDQDDRINKTPRVQKRSKPCTRKDNSDSSRNIDSVELLDDGEMNLENMHVNHYESRPNRDNELTCLDYERTENNDQPDVQSALMEFDDYFSVEELRFSFYLYAMHSRKKSKFVQDSARKNEEGKPRRIKKHSGVDSSDDSDVSDDLNDPYYRIDKEDQPYEPNIELPLEKRSYPKRKRVTRKHFTLLDHDPPDTTVETTDKSGSESDEGQEEGEEEVSQQIHDELNEEEEFINGIFLEAGYGIDLSFPADDEIFNDSGESDYSNDDGQIEEDEGEDVIMVNDFEGSQFLVKDCKGEVKVEDCKVCLASSVDKENSNLESNRSQETGHDVKNDVIDATMADRKPTARKSALPHKVKNIVLNKGRKRKRARRLKYTSHKKKASSQKTADGTGHSMSPNLTVNTRPIESEVKSVVNPLHSPNPPSIKQFPPEASSSIEPNRSQSNSITSESSRCRDTSSSESKLFQPSFIKPPSSPGPPYIHPLKSPAPTSLPDVKPELYATQLKSPGPPIVKQLKPALSSPPSPGEYTQTGPFSPGAPYVRPINSPGPPTVRQVDMATTGTNSNPTVLSSVSTTAVQRASRVPGPPLVVYQKVTDPASQLHPQLPRVTPLRPVLCIPMSDPAAAALQMYQRRFNGSRSNVATNHHTGSPLGIVDSSVGDINTPNSKTPVQAVPCSVNQGNFSVCEYCNKRFKSLLCAKIHFWVDHQQLSYNRDLLLPMTRASQQEVSNRICPYCRFNLVGDDERLFEKHILTHLQLLPYVCATCSFPAVSFSVLEKHTCFAERVIPLKQEVVEPVLSEKRFEVKVEQKPTVTLCQELLVKKEMG